MKLFSHSSPTFLLDGDWGACQLDCSDFQPQSSGKNNFFTTQFVKVLVECFALMIPSFDFLKIAPKDAFHSVYGGEQEDIHQFFCVCVFTCL